MTTLAVNEPAPRAPAVGAYDRVFYGGMAALMALTAFAGFAPTYYLRPFAGGPATTVSGAPITPLLHLHAAVFTAWVLLFLVQTALVARRRVRLHRRLGVAGAALAAAMLVVGMSTALTGARNGVAPPGVDPLLFLVVPFFDVLLFAALAAAAIWKRRDKEAHKRLMLLAYVALMPAPVARLPGVLSLGPLGFYLLSFVFLLLGIAYDGASRRRVHPAYWWGGAALVLMAPGRFLLGATEGWRAFAGWLVG